MKALLCVEPGKLELTERERPSDREGFVRIRIANVGICGTDYHIYGGKQPFLSYPRVMGHELSGYALNPSSDGRIASDDLVVVNPYITCGNCHACSVGKPNCCEQIAVLGVHADGGMCEEIVVPEGNVYRADGLTEEAAAMVEFLAIGAHGVARSRISANSSVLVVGAGPIGIAAAIFARIAGANVTLTDTSAKRLDLAKNAVGGIAAHLPENMPTVTYETVFDATGNINAMNAGLKWLAHGGTYTLLSVVKDDLCFPDPEFHKRETTMLASRNALKADFEHVMASIRDNKVPIEALATHRTSFEDAVQNLPEWSRDRDNVIKAIIKV